MINNFNDFIFTENIENSSLPVCNFAIYKIVINNDEYSKVLVKEERISYANINTIIENIQNIEANIEYSLFSLDREITYDNKNKGGRLIFNLYNMMDNYDNKNINYVLHYFPESQNLSLMKRFFFTLSMLLVFKNYYTDKLNLTIFSLKVINSIEGIIIQKNEKNIKIVISFDEDYLDDELTYLARIVKILLFINPSITFKYNRYTDINKAIIIR